MTTTDETVELLQAGKEDTYLVTTTDEGWIEVRNNPLRQLNRAEKLDFLRLVHEDDDYWRLYHLTANGVLKGSASFSGAFVGAIYGIVTDFFATL